MALALAGAWAQPLWGTRGGPLVPEVTVDQLATGALFLLSGLALPFDGLFAAAAQVLFLVLHSSKSNL
jgi:hypothetical protein